MEDSSTEVSKHLVETEAATYGYGNLLPCAFLVCYSPDWWVDTGANIHTTRRVGLFDVLIGHNI